MSRYFNKGKLIAIEGSLRNNNYQDRNHPDVTHYTMDVQVDNVEFVGGRSDNSSSVPQQHTHSQSESAGVSEQGDFNLSDFEEILSDGDVPF